MVSVLVLVSSMATAGPPGSRIQVDRLIQDAEFALVGRPLSVRKEKVFYPDEQASSADMCVVDLEVTDQVVGSIESGRVDLWIPCDDIDATAWVRGVEGDIQTVWLLASRLQGLRAYGYRLDDDAFAEFPYASDAVVPQSMHTVWIDHKGTVLPAAGGAPLCFEPLADETGAHVVWCGAPGDFSTVWEGLVQAMAAVPAGAILGKAQ